MVESSIGGGGGGKGGVAKRDLLKPVAAPVVPKLKDLPADAAEDLLKSSGFPAGTGRIAQAGWSGNTEVTRKGIGQLLSDAQAEAEAQQGGK